MNKPKISIILPVYNIEKYLLASLRSIQNHSFKYIEIIFIDEASTDKSIVNWEIKKDERIILIKNVKNKGLLITRKIGVLASKGEYISPLDSDDLLIEPILNTSYCYGRKNNLNIVEFQRYENFGKKLIKFKHSYKTSIIKQPELSNIIFYYNNQLKQTHNTICTRLIIFLAYDNNIEFTSFVNEMLKERYVSKHMNILANIIVINT